MARNAWMIVVLALLAAGLAFVLLTEKRLPEAPARQATRPPADPTPTPDPATEASRDGAVLHGAPGAGPATPPTPLPTAQPGAGTRFTGKVLDAAGNPAADAEVEAATTEGVLASAVTDASGTFRFRLVVTDTLRKRVGLLRARGTDGAVALLPLTFPPLPRKDATATPPNAPRDVGTLRLGPPQAFDVRVVSDCAAGLPATLWLVSTTLGTSPPWTTVETDAQGAATIQGVPAGGWMLVASAPGCGRARILVQLPREATDPVEIELPTAHVLTVSVRNAEDHAPIAGARVRVWEQWRLPRYRTQAPLISVPSAYTTDEAGIALIDGLGGDETLVLATEAEGYPLGSQHIRGRGRGPGEARVAPGQSEVLIELHRPLTVRWPIKAEGLGIPADGTEVRVVPWTNTGRLTVPPTGVIEGGEVVVEGWGTDGASGYAIVDEAGGHGQAIARLSASPGETKGYPTSFHALRKIDLVLSLSDGSPAEGWFLTARDGGNNPLKPAVRTNAEGRATLEGLYGGPGALVNVSVSDQEGWGGFTMQLGSVDLFKQDGRFEATIPRERTLRIRLTIQGRAVPESFPGRPTLNGRPIAPTEDVDDAHEEGVFLATWRPRKENAKVYVSAQAAGYLAETRTFSPADLAEGDEVVVDLRPAGGLRVRVTEPEDKRYRIAPDRWDTEHGTWVSPGAQPGLVPARSQRADADGIVAFPRLEPGRYRAVETLTGLTSTAVDVRAGGDPAEIDFDVSATGWVRGRVIVPEGTSWKGVRVGTLDAEPRWYDVQVAGAAALPGTPVNPEDGTFQVRVPGNRPITLRLFHATLRPHPTKGRVTVTRPQGGVELHAILGPTTTVHFATPAPVVMNRGRPRLISVRLYEGEVKGAGIRLSGALDGAHTTVSFGGYEPGTYTVWIDAPGRAPVVLDEVMLGTDDTDLGTVALSPGATFELHVTVKEGQSPPRYAVWLTKLDEPTYTRHTDGAGERIKVEGLGAGRFRLSATAYNGASPYLDEEIESDGHARVVRTVDAR